jgi:hypothetical protein
MIMRYTTICISILTLLTLLSAQTPNAFAQTPNTSAGSFE